MTEQNSLARSYSSDMMEDDDPLAELARIVSGQSSRPAHQPLAAKVTHPEPAPAIWPDEEDVTPQGYNHAEPVDQEVMPASAQAHSATYGLSDDAGFDLESELMRELGGAVDQHDHSTNVSDMLAELEAQSPADENVGHEAASEPDVLPDLSLEDQLMAELGFTDNTAPAQPPMQPTVHHVGQVPVHRQTAMAQPTKAWTRATPISANPAPHREQAVSEPHYDNDPGGDLETEFAEIFSDKAAPEDNYSQPEPSAPMTELDDFASRLLGERDYSDTDQDFGAIAEEVPPAAVPAAQDGDAFDFDSAFAEEFADTSFAQTAPVPPAAPVRQGFAPQPRQTPVAPVQQKVARPFEPEEAGLPDLEDEFAAVFEDELNLSDEVPARQAKAPVWKRIASGFGSRRNANAAVAHEKLDDTAMAEDAVDDNNYYDPELDEPEMPLAVRSRSNGFRFAGFALFGALVLGLGAVSYGYFSGGAPTGEPVVIKADTDPVKVKPSDPGGAEVANQDKAAYERVTGNFAGDTTQEKLVSGTEAPVEIVSEPETVQDASNLEAKADARLTPQADETALAPVAAALEPRKVRTMAVLPDGTVIAPSETPQTTDGATSELALAPIDGPVETSALAPATRSPADQTAVASAQPVVKEVAQATTRSAAKSPGTRVATAKPKIDSDEPIKIAPAVQPAAENTQTASVQRSEWAVQVASQRSAEEANSAYSNLKRKFPNILDGRQMAVQRAEIEGKGVFFRVRMQAESKEEAVNLCEKLKAAGGSCFVTR
ncbi:MAG: SPOR domain-containing protein [Nitratireductor sp.]